MAPRFRKPHAKSSPKERNPKDTPAPYDRKNLEITTIRANKKREILSKKKPIGRNYQLRDITLL